MPPTKPPRPDPDADDTVESSRPVSDTRSEPGGRSRTTAPGGGGEDAPNTIVIDEEINDAVTPPKGRRVSGSRSGPGRRIRTASPGGGGGDVPDSYDPYYVPPLSGGQRAWRAAKRVAFWGAIAGVAGVLAVAGVVAYYSTHLPKFDSLKDYHPPVASRVKSADGTTLAEYFLERRTVIAMTDIPDVMVKAMLSAEDKSFYEHSGINPLAMLRAAVRDVVARSAKEGASTLTQQLVKTMLLTREKRISRKIKEAILSFRIEHNLSKDDILWMYLNEVDFGSNRYGIEEATRYFFGHSARELKLGEAAMLAGMVKSPETLTPRRNPKGAKGRQSYVLRNMAKNGYITEAQAAAEIERPIVLASTAQDVVGTTYLEHVRRQLIERYGEETVQTGGLTVEIAMSAALQKAAERAVQDGLRMVDKRQGWRGAQVTGLSDEALLGARETWQKRLAGAARLADSVNVIDLQSLKQEQSAGAGDLGQAGHVRRLEEDSLYGGVVEAVDAKGATVSFATDGVSATGRAPFSTMTWARPFSPARGTPKPSSAKDVLKAGDVALFRVTRLVTTRGESGAKVKTLELALEQDAEVQAAFAAIDLKTRGVVALVGGYDAAVSAFDRATQAKRQPGSAFKPLLYAAAIDSQKYTPITMVDDSPEVIRDQYTGQTWKPENFEKDQFDGQISLRKALAESKNTVAVKLLEDLGLERVKTMAKNLGLSTPIPDSYTAALGSGEVIPLDLINAYATLATMGRRAPYVTIRRVLDKSGAVLEDHTQVADPDYVVRPAVAYVVTDLMRSVIDDADGTAHRLAEMGRIIAGKTGTASEHRDAWFIGYTPSLIAGAWVGFDNHDMLGNYEQGGHAAAPIWQMFMQKALDGTPKEEFPVPPGVTQVKINPKSGLLAAPDDPYARMESFVAGTEPTQVAGSEQPAAPEDFFRNEP